MNPRRDVPLVLLTQNMLPRCKDMYTEHHNKTFLTGLIRGNFEDKPSPRWCRNVDLRIRDRDGIWVPIKEILRVFNEACPNAGQWGVGALIRLAKHDKRGRLQFRGPGPEHDPRAETVSLPCYPLEVAAVQGHSQNIQDLSGMEPEELDAQIAVSWLCLKNNEELEEMEDASLRGVPFLAWEDCPRHLYHRTTKDAAISILNQDFKPGHRDSGKMHVYFADKPLEEMEHGTAGVRADHPVEVVVSTKEVLEAGLTLFYTQSEGVLCRSEIPAFTILQVRDTRDDEILYIKAFPEAEPEPEMDARPEPAEEIEEIEAEPERPETPRASTASAAPAPALSLPQKSAVTEANQEMREEGPDPEQSSIQLLAQLYQVCRLMPWCRVRRWMQERTSSNAPIAPLTSSRARWCASAAEHRLQSGSSTRICAGSSTSADVSLRVSSCSALASDCSTSPRRTLAG